ncbi:MAG: sigma-54 dependent transcriptional regulator [Sandaracinaceae bacterium]|nr:sigma-54 dependent transcriptional regulator [Sandaracinaceae bacterium]
MEPFEADTPMCGLCRKAAGDGGLQRCSRMIAESRALRAVLARAAPVASSDAPVVVLGESGAGKEVLARAIHANSLRAERPFVAVNMAALPADLLESELFGHTKGAFTGAVAASEGLMKAADGGTLFLDEIAEMPLALQAKLLRALDRGEVRPVGGAATSTLNVRIICATNRDLRQHVETGRFRADLYYRLKVFLLRLPPLRERVEDIAPLVRRFLERAGGPGPAISAEAMRLLEGYEWPGNIRELANAVTHAATYCGRGEIRPEHLPEELLGSRPAAGPVAHRTLAQMEREHIAAVLEACAGNRAEAARVLGIGRNTLWRKLRRHSLET